MNKLYTIYLIICCSLIQAAYGQNNNGSIKGIVKTSDGKPATYVSVGLKGTNKGTTTNDEGHYVLTNIKPGVYQLKVSFVGLKTQEEQVTVKAGQQTIQDFILTENASQLNEVVVNGAQQKKPVTLGKANINPLDLPQSTGVVTSQVIADQQAIRLGDVIKNVTGVTLTQTRNGVAETFSARGSIIGIAGSGGSIFKNGIITNTQGFPDASTLESVEVLKGSSALLYGSVSGGLVINMVTKKPRFDWGGSVSMLVGSYQQYKPTVDVYGPISKNVAFRVVATHEDANSFRDVINTHRTYVNPSLLFKAGKNTDILLEGDYLKSDIMPDAGVGVPNSRITITEMPIAPRNRYIYPAWAYNNTNQGDVYLTVNHKFNDTWKLTAIGGYQSTRVLGLTTGVPNSITAAGDYTRALSGAKTGEKDYSAQANLNGAFKTGAIGHQLLIGTDVTRVKNESGTLKYTSAAGVVGTAYDKINIYDPSKYLARIDEPTLTDTARTTTPTNRYGVYIQDMVSITSKFKVLAGIRWTFQRAYQATFLNLNNQNVTKTGNPDKVDKAYSPKVALIYQPVQTTSIYATYSNNFTFNSGTDIYGSVLPPSYVGQYEAGVKNEFLNGRLSANLSVYRIRNSNLSQTALLDKDGKANTNTNLKTLNGQTTSDGVEVDFNGTITKNFYFMAGYSYNFARYTNTTGATGSQVEGERLSAVPKNTANGTVFYTFDRGSVKGLKLGVSAFYTGQRYGGNNNTNGPTGYNTTATVKDAYNGLIPLNGFVTTDLSAGYTYHSISLLTKLSNIFDTFNYVAHDRYSINPIPPRMFAATLAYKF